MKAKILVADDSATIQKIVAMSFENEDYSVVGVNNGKQAFDKLAEVRPDIVLADTDMPGLTGYQLSQKIKASKEFSAIKVLLLTSDFEDFNEGLFKNCNADGHISKPFKSDEIVKKVSELLNNASGSPSAGEPELLSLSATDIIDDADLPQAILLEEDAIVPATALSPDSVVSDTKSQVPASAEDEFNFDNIFNETFSTTVTDSISENTKEVPAPDEDATLADLVRDLEKMDLPPVQELRDDTALVAESGTEKTDDSGILDAMVKDLENLKLPETTEKPRGVDADFLAETSEPRLDDDLDKVFSTLKKQEPAPSRPKMGVPEHVENVSQHMSRIKNVEPEPDDLLEKMAPSAFSRQSELKPDLIKESLAFLSEKKLGKKNGKKEEFPEPSTAFSPVFESAEGKFNLLLGDHINAILERSLSAAIKSEVAGLSDVIIQSVKEIVREVTPHIAREVIREEIEKIRDLENM